MGSASGTKTPWHLWLIGGLAVLWTGMGVAVFVATITGSIDTSAFPEDQIEFFNNTPLWANVFWGIGVFFCLFGSIGILLRSAFAPLLFAVSIIGLIGSTIYQRLVAGLPETMQSAGHTMFALAIWAITFFLFSMPKECAIGMFYADWISWLMPVLWLRLPARRAGR